MERDLELEVKNAIKHDESGSMLYRGLGSLKQVSI